MNTGATKPGTTRSWPRWIFLALIALAVTFVGTFDHDWDDE